jgi:DNA-directed RNA polymerase specialized sigma24 family protein
MFHSTNAENFESWDKFLDAYYEPIRAALRLIPAVGEAGADDVAQSFFLKMYERDILEKRPTITGRFRNWLYVAARHHAVDEWRKTRRNPERPGAFEANEPIDSRVDGNSDVQFDADEFYALSVLHMTVARVRKHLLEEGKSEHWMIFEELVLAPIIPGRVAKTREELLAMFPGHDPGFLDNRVTTVKRVFRRMLPALIPADPTENLTTEERFEELIEILHARSANRLWLAFLTSPTPGPDGSPSSSLELAESAPGKEPSGAAVSADILHDELRILLGFWLEMPLHEYLDDLERVGPIVAGIIREARHHGPRGGRPRTMAQFNLKAFVAGIDPSIPAIPPEELTGLLERLKLFSKRVHRALKIASQGNAAHALTRRDNSMPLEIAQVLYNLAGALALTRCQARIIGLADDRYRKNVLWMLSQPWLDARLRPVFFAVLKQLGQP